MSSFHAGIDGHVVIPGTYTAAGGTTNFHIGYQPNHDRPARPRTPFSIIPFAPDPDFVDRPDILAWIRDKCAGPGARAALVGLSGMGKSQLAIQHAYHVRDAAPHTFVFWVNASTQARFEEAYRRIADRLELLGRDRPEANVSQLVCSWLQDEANGTWLMILDNADDINVFYPKQVHARDRSDSTSTSLADYLPQSRNGSILITSRNKDAAARLVGGHRNIKEVVAFGEAQALQLLRSKLCDTSNSESASELLRTLGYLPLAITQAAAYINRHAPQVTIQDYLDELGRSSKSKESLLNHDGGDLRRDKSVSNSVVTTCQVTFERAREERRSAVDLLSLMSFFNPQAIPEFALRHYARSADGGIRSMRGVLSVLQHRKGQYRSDGEKGFRDDITVLQAYSLVSATAEKGVLKMHPLVQHCTIAWLASARKAERYRMAFIEVIKKEFLTKRAGDWEESKQLIPHIDAFYPGEPGERSFDRWVALTIGVGWSLWKKGKYNEAVIARRRALEGTERELGAQHLDTLTRVSELASVLGDQGKYDEAERLNRRVLAGVEKELGVQHPHTLTSVGNLASVLQAQGKYDEAEKLHRRALAGMEKELGVQHPHTLTSMGNLASVLQAQGKYDEAEKLHRQALAGMEKELGVQHPHTLTSMSKLASVLEAQGKYDEAEKLNRRVLAGREKELGVQHPHTLTSAYCLAYLLHKTKHYTEAAQLYQRAYDGYVEKLGPQHPQTVACSKDFAALYQEAEQAALTDDQNLAQRSKVLDATSTQRILYNDQ